MSDQLPPSYEAATGISATPQSDNDESLPPKPSAPTSDNMVTPLHPTTTPLPYPTTTTLPFQQQQQQSSYPVNSSHSTNIPMPQTNVIMCRRPHKRKTNLWILAIVAIIAVIIIVVIIIIGIRNRKPKYHTHDFNDAFKSVYAKEPEIPPFDWDAFYKNNQEMFDRWNNQGYEIPKSHFD